MHTSWLSRLVRALAAAFFAAYAAFAAWLVLPLEPHERAHSAACSSGGGNTEDDDRRPCVSFGGCGFLYPYELGAAAYIAEHFDVASLRCAGHSAGFAPALTLSAGVPASVHWDVMCAARRRWARRALGPFLDATRAWMAPYATALQPHAARIASAASEGRLALGYTRLVLTRSWPPLRAGHAVTASFDSLAAFVYAVTVSQRCVPFYRSPGWLHGAWGLDGAFSAQFTHLPGARAERVATVSPTNPLADVAPATPLPPSWFFTLPDADRWAKLLEARAMLIGMLRAAAARLY
jgi:hypothetical protein